MEETGSLSGRCPAAHCHVPARDAILHPSLIACARVVCRSVRKENRDVCVHCLLCEMDLDKLNQV